MRAFFTVFAVMSLTASNIMGKVGFILIIVLSILKIIGCCVFEWFAPIGELGAVSTGIWLIVSGFILYVVSIFILTVVKTTG